MSLRRLLCRSLIVLAACSLSLMYFLVPELSAGSEDWYVDQRGFGLPLNSAFGSEFLDLDPALDHKIIELERRNPFQMNRAQYTRIAWTIQQCQQPCNVLIWGLGNDSPLWNSINVKGRTLFLEDNQEWIDLVTGKSPELQARFVRFPVGARLPQAAQIYNDVRALQSASDFEGARQLLATTLPQGLTSEDLDTHWDIIVVDAPPGTESSILHRLVARIGAFWGIRFLAEFVAPSRMGSIYSSSLLIGSNAVEGIPPKSTAAKKRDKHVFVHDCGRQIEQAFALLCLGFKQNFEVVYFKPLNVETGQHPWPLDRSLLLDFKIS